jgi:hypothetical protein
MARVRATRNNIVGGLCGAALGFALYFTWRVWF